jgi:hypothetical protein
MRLIVHGTKYIQGSSKEGNSKSNGERRVRESGLSRNSIGEGSKIEGRT